MKIKPSAFTFKLISAALSVSLLLISWGCATPGPQSFRSPLPEETRWQVRSVAVVPATYIPESNFLTFAKGRGSGALKGAASEALHGTLYMSAEAAKAGPFGALLLPFMAALGAVVGAIVGGIEGAVKAVPADEAQKVEAAINSAISDLDVQEKLAGRMVSAGLTLKDHQFSLIRGQGPATKDEKPHYRSLKGQNADMALEVNVKSLGFLGGKGADPEIAFFMDVTVRVVRIVDGSEIYLGESSHISRPRRLSEWAQDGAAVLRQEFETSYARLAEQILENLFLVYDFHVDSMWSGAMHCMLKPYNPPPSGIGFFSLELMFSKVDSLRPTFQWEAFPREKDLKSDSAGILTRVGEITYDLKIWKGHNGYPEELVYDRQGVSAPERVIEITETQVASTVLGQSEQAPIVSKERIVEHTIETLLEPSTEYFWSVRSRFKLDGQTRITKWSYSRIPWPPGLSDLCLTDHIPKTHYHRFKTPKE